MHSSYSISDLLYRSHLYFLLKSTLPILSTMTDEWGPSNLIYCPSSLSSMPPSPPPPLPLACLPPAGVARAAQRGTPPPSRAGHCGIPPPFGVARRSSPPLRPSYSVELSSPAANLPPPATPALELRRRRPSRVRAAVELGGAPPPSLAVRQPVSCCCSSSTTAGWRAMKGRPAVEEAE